MAGTPTRFPGGVATAISASIMGQYGMPDPTQWITYFTDLCGGWDTFPNATDQNYTVTKTGAGTVAPTDGAGGLALITNAAADNDAVFLQRRGEAFRWSSAKRMLFQARFKVSDATQSDVIMGLQITDTTPLDVTDGIFFIKADDAATLSFVVEKDNVQVTQACGSMANDTYIVVGFYYNGKPVVVNGTTTYVFDVYVNGSLVGQRTATTTVPDDEDLCVSFGVQNGEAVAKTMTVDYIFAAVER
jgi:hypothetical protein